jgi:crotonobetainyl-CoA:carnitine CoA-transferase CaiB-like acyl-CoA transferase
MNERALEGVRVLDLTQYIAGPMATWLLAGYGADVIKIERPDGGDPARRMGPFYKDEVSPEKGGLFLYLNMGKRGITLNLKHPLAVDMFKELVKTADIVIESFRPGVMARLGIGYETLEKINPGLVMTSISNFGQTGPYRDYGISELVLYGMGGMMQTTGSSQREPVKNGETISLHQMGFYAATGTLGAYLGSVFQGMGQYVDMSMIEALITNEEKAVYLMAYQHCGDEQPRMSSIESGYPYGTYPCRDGYFDMQGGSAYWDRVVDMFADQDFLKDPKWHGPAAQADPVLKEEFEVFFLNWSMEHGKQEIMDIAQEHRVPCGAVQDVSEVLADPDLNQRGLFTEVSHPVVGKLKYPGRPFIMSETPFQTQRPAPLLGEHNAEIYAELGYCGEDLTHLAEWKVI